MASRRIAQLALYHARKHLRPPLTPKQRERKQLKDRERWARIRAKKNEEKSI
jgi:hypothetical protein